MFVTILIHLDQPLIRTESLFRIIPYHIQWPLRIITFIENILDFIRRISLRRNSTSVANKLPYFHWTKQLTKLCSSRCGYALIHKSSAHIIYSDPEKNPDAKKFAELTYLDVLSQKLKVMDSTAISLCMDNELPVLVYNLLVPGNLTRVARGEPIGTIVRGGGS